MASILGERVFRIDGWSRLISDEGGREYQDLQNRRKKKALAETAALLVLRKKLNASGGGARGRLTSHPELRQFVGWIKETIDSGARKRLACEEVGLSLRTYQRWTQEGIVSQNKRADAIFRTLKYCLQWHHGDLSH